MEFPTHVQSPTCLGEVVHMSAEDSMWIIPLAIEHMIGYIDASTRQIGKQR